MADNKDSASKKTGENKAAAQSNFSKKIGEYKGEFSKIIWPSREELCKNTIVVIITCFIFGLLIFGFDYAFNSLMSIFTKMVA